MNFVQLDSLTNLDGRMMNVKLPGSGAAGEPTKLLHALFAKTSMQLRYQNPDVESMFLIHFYEDRFSITICWILAFFIGVAMATPSMVQSETMVLAVTTTGIASLVFACVSLCNVWLLRECKEISKAASLGETHTSTTVNRWWLLLRATVRRRVEVNAQRQEWCIVVGFLAALLYASYIYPARAINCDQVSCSKYIDIDAALLFFLPLPLAISPLRFFVLAPLFAFIFVTFFAVRFIPGSLEVYGPLFASYAVVTTAATIVTVSTAFFHERWRRSAFERLAMLHLEAHAMTVTRELVIASVGYAIPAVIARRINDGESVVETSHCASVAVFSLQNSFAELYQSGPAETVQRLQWLAVLLDQRKRHFPGILKMPSRGDHFVVACGPFAGGLLGIGEECQTFGAAEEHNHAERRSYLALMVLDFVRAVLAEVREHAPYHQPIVSQRSGGTDDQASHEGNASIEGGTPLYMSLYTQNTIVCAVDCGTVKCTFGSNPSECLVASEAIDRCVNLVRRSSPKSPRHHGGMLLVTDTFRRVSEAQSSLRFVQQTPATTESPTHLKTLHAIMHSGNNNSTGSDYSSSDNATVSQNRPLSSSIWRIKDDTTLSGTSRTMSSGSMQCGVQYFHCTTDTIPADTRLSATSPQRLKIEVTPPDNASLATSTIPVIHRIKDEVRMEWKFPFNFEFHRHVMETGYRLHLKEATTRGSSQWMAVCFAVMSLSLLVVALIYKFSTSSSELGLVCLGVALIADIGGGVFSVYYHHGEYPCVTSLLFVVHTGLWYAAMALMPADTMMHDEQLVWATIILPLGMLREPVHSVSFMCFVDLIVIAPLIAFTMTGSRTGKIRVYVIVGQFIVWLICATSRVLQERAHRFQFANEVQRLLYTAELENDYAVMESLLLKFVPHRIAIRLLENLRESLRRPTFLPTTGDTTNIDGGATIHQRAEASESQLIASRNTIGNQPTYMQAHVATMFTTHTVDMPFAVLWWRLPVVDGASGYPVDIHSTKPSVPIKSSPLQKAEEVDGTQLVWSVVKEVVSTLPTISCVMDTGDSCVLVDDDHTFDDKLVTLLHAVRAIDAAIKAKVVGQQQVPLTAVLHSGPLIGAVLGRLALRFAYFGEAMHTATAILTEAPPTAVVWMTQRFAQHLRCVFLKALNHPTLHETEESLESLSMQATCGVWARISEPLRWCLRGRPSPIYVRSVIFYDDDERSSPVVTLAREDPPSAAVKRMTPQRNPLLPPNSLT